MIKIIKYHPKDLTKSSFEVTFRGNSETDLNSQIFEFDKQLTRANECNISLLYDKVSLN